MELPKNPQTEAEHRFFIESVIRDQKELLKLSDAEKLELMEQIKKETEWVNQMISDTNTRIAECTEFLEELRAFNKQ